MNERDPAVPGFFSFILLDFGFATGFFFPFSSCS